MVCRNCGTEIADKALICYRCGEAVDEPAVRPPSPPRARQSSLLTSLAMVVFVLAALFMGRTMEGEAPQALSWLMLGLALIVSVWRLIVGRRRR